jgi:hypothetical protein
MTNVLHPFGTGMPSDKILHRYGFDGHEANETLVFCKRHAHLGLRSTFALNTFYKEVNGGYYVNRALFVLIDAAVRQFGLLPVLFDCYQANGLIPIEGEGHLNCGEEYALISAESLVVGMLSIWQFRVGGGGRYYGDSVIFDFILPRKQTQELIDLVEHQCTESGVCFARESSVAVQP